MIRGPVRHDSVAGSAVTNPTLLAEVLSPSTAEYDRTDKFDHYRQLGALRQNVLIDPKTGSIEVRTRKTKGTWVTRISQSGQIAELGSIGVQVAVSELFAMAAEPTS